MGRCRAGRHHIPALQHLGEIEVATIRFEYDEINNEVVSHQILELPIHLNAVAPEDFSKAKPNEEVLQGQDREKSKGQRQVICLTFIRKC